MSEKVYDQCMNWICNVRIAEIEFILYCLGRCSDSSKNNKFKNAGLKIQFVEHNYY